MADESVGYVGHTVSAPDGLALFVRDYGPRLADRLPVLCLPGLTRNSADFEELATALATDPQTPRRVLALDFRGRGQSARDPNPKNYDVAVEAADVLAVTTALDVGRAVFVGTSRGGLVTMALAPLRPSLIAGAVLNDIGPLIDPKGLVRIKGYVGKLPQPRTFAEGGEILKRISDAQFPTLSAAQWERQARQIWTEERGRLVLAYDPAIAGTLANFDPQVPLPPLWPLFDALADVPLMVVRGLNSDLLSAETVAEMKARRSSLETLDVPDQGHAPLLAEPETIAAIARFIAGCDHAPGH